jgi:hypothetical protein
MSAVSGFRFQVSGVIATLACTFFVYASYGESALIPEHEINTLEASLKQVTRDGGRSRVASRRAFKNVARQGVALVEAHPDAENRFSVLTIIFQARKNLLALTDAERDRVALFETCKALSKAPDAYADIRLEAELLLSDKQLSDREATQAERSAALAAILERYAGTSAEAKSLLMAALIVQKLDDKELESQILYTLDENYADDHEVIEFRRKYLKIGRLDLVFSGRHKRLDGNELVFPFDTMGHMSLMVFWSKDRPGITNYLQKVKADVDKAGGTIRVFSFNVDQLADGGQSILKEQDLDWIVMQLPRGRDNQTYKTYAQADAVAVFVNAYGITVIKPEIVHGREPAVDGSRLSESRYMAQLQSLFIGDFLAGAIPLLSSVIADSPAPSKGDNALKTMAVIENGIVPPPFRYRMTAAEARERYQDVVTACDSLLDTESELPVRSALIAHRILALLGLWRLTFDPNYLFEADDDAMALLHQDLDSTMRVIPLFCRATVQMRSGSESAEAVVASFEEACGGENASAFALAAATMLSIEAGARDLYEQYRARILAQSVDPSLYAFSSFLRDRHHQFRVLRANYTLRERRARGYIVGHGYDWPTRTLPDVTFKSLDGKTLELPRDTAGKITYLMVVEPPAGGGTNNWEKVRDSSGRIRQQSKIHMLVDVANALVKKHVHQNLQCIVAFLTDDADHVKFLMETNGWDACEAVLVPGGLHHPMVNQLGILSADNVPNIMVLRRDGTMAWYGSGLFYKNEFGYPFAVQLAMKVHVEVCEIEHAFKLLVAGEYEQAATAFENPFPEEQPQRYSWRAPRYHGQALAFAGLQQWDQALAAIDKAIDAHKLRHYHGYGRRGKLTDWRQDAAKVEIKEPCDVVCLLWQEKAMIMDKLGRKEEAVGLREQAANSKVSHRPYVYSTFHYRLHDLERK